jgi:hypothetical protein
MLFENTWQPGRIITKFGGIGKMVVNAQFYEPDRYARDRQFDRASQMTGEQRLRLTFSLSAMEIMLIKLVIKRENSGATQDELDVLFVRTCYDDLADRVAAEIAKRRRGI